MFGGERPEKITLDGSDAIKRYNSVLTACDGKESPVSGRRVRYQV
jgi:hypothetical protein